MVHITISLLFIGVNYCAPMAYAEGKKSTHCLESCPKYANTTAKNEKGRIEHPIYTLQNNSETKLADWVAYKVRKENFNCSMKMPRRNWKTDPKLEGNDTLTSKEYDDSNVTLYVDRGHQAPLASFKCHTDVQTTNYLSNITPQFTKLNQGAWKKLENAVRTLANQHEDVWILTGPLFEWPMAKLPSTEKTHEIPSSYWKIVSIIEDGSVKATAFYFYQDTPKRANYCDHVKSIDFVEAKSKLDFFSSYNAQSDLERTLGLLTNELGC